MPFKSEKQRRYLWATHPDIAKEWAHKYPESNKGLPMYVNDKKDNKKSAPKEKAANLDVLGLISPYVDSRTYTKTSILDDFPAENDKNAGDKLIKVDMPHSTKPTYAGQEREEGENPQQQAENTSIEQKNPENAINSLLQKISVVLSQPMAQLLERQKAMQEGREPVYQPRNPGIRRYAMPSATVPPPMGMQPQPAQPQQQPQPAQPQQQQGAGMKSPSANPINSFGGLSVNGNINGNAAFGVKNSPGSSKSAGIFLRDLPANQAEDIKLPVGKSNSPFQIAQKYREPRLLLKPFYDSDQTAMRKALEMAATLDPDIMNREMLSDNPLNRHDAMNIGMNLKTMYPDRFRLPADIEKALDVQPDAIKKRRRVVEMLKGAGIKTAGGNNEALAKIMGMDGPPIADPEDLDYEDDARSYIKSAVQKWSAVEEPMTIPMNAGVAAKRKKKKRVAKPAYQPLPRARTNNALAGAIGAGAAAFPLYSMHQDAFGTYNTLNASVKAVPPERLLFPHELAAQGLVQHGDIGTYFGEPQNIFSDGKPNTSKLTQGGEWTSGSGTYHGMLLRPFTNNGRPDFQALEGGDAWPTFQTDAGETKYDSPFHRFIAQRDAEDARLGRIPQNEVGMYGLAAKAPGYNSHLDDWQHTTSRNPFNRYYNAITHATAQNQPETVAQMSLPERIRYYLRHFKRQGELLEDYKRQAKPEDMAAGYDPMSTRRRHPMLISRAPQVTQLLESQNPGVRDQTVANIDTAFDKHYPMRPYNLGSAIAAGTRRVFFPHVPKFKPTGVATAGGPKEVAPLPPPTCNEDYCVQPAARVLNHHGLDTGVRPSMVLPADLAANPSVRPVSLMVPRPIESQETVKDEKGNDVLGPDNKPLLTGRTLWLDRLTRKQMPLKGTPDAPAPEDKAILDDYKRRYQSTITDKWMPESRNRRVMAGLAAAAILGAAGYGTTKFVQNKLRKRRRALEALKREEAREKLEQRKLRKAASEQPYELSPFLLKCITQVVHNK